MKISAEWVSPGHPDKTADAIASYILDKNREMDPYSRVGLEVQLKDNICNLAGEVTSAYDISDSLLRKYAQDAIRRIGYTEEYVKRWPFNATLNVDKLVFHNYIGRQSPQIAAGVDQKGWGDQGVFMGMAVPNPATDYLPADVYLAQKIGMNLYLRARDNKDCAWGLDIKTLVTMEVIKTDLCNVRNVVVAAPWLPENDEPARRKIKEIVEATIEDYYKNARTVTAYELIINGTGSFVTHSSVGDAGVVGRKLAVDFYGLNCPIGGGCPWGKDPTKADVSLNILARFIALQMAKRYNKTVFVRMSCCIGQTEVGIAVETADGTELCSERIYLPTEKVINEILLLNDPQKSFFDFVISGKGIPGIADSIGIAETEITPLAYLNHILGAQ